LNLEDKKNDFITIEDNMLCFGCTLIEYTLSEHKKIF